MVTAKQANEADSTKYAAHQLTIYTMFNTSRACPRIHIETGDAMISISRPHRNRHHTATFSTIYSAFASADWLSLATSL